MLKAIFLDYTGTITQEAGPDMEQLLMRCYQNSDAPTPKEMLKFWWGAGRAKLWGKIPHGG